MNYGYYQQDAVHQDEENQAKPLHDAHVCVIFSQLRTPMFIRLYNKDTVTLHDSLM